VRAALVGVAVVVAMRAAAADPAVAAIAAGADARGSVIVGPSGQVYDPDGRGSWIRHRAGGVGDAIGVAAISGDGVIAGAADAAAAHGPPYQWQGGAWHALPLALRAHAVVGRGTRTAAAVNRSVWTLDGAPKQLPEAPAAVTMLGASARGVAIATGKGVFRLDGKQWKPVDRAPAVVALLDDRWAQTEGGVFDLRSGKAIAWPSGLPPVTAAAVDPDGDVIGAGADGHGLAIAVVAHDHAASDRMPNGVLTGPIGAVAAVAIDRHFVAVVALADGRVVIRDGTQWSATAVRDELPAPRAGAPPATSR
jgi:hypothetical protein